MFEYNQLLNIAKIAFLDKNYHLSLEKFNHALQLKPNDTWVLKFRSQVKLNLKDYEGAESDATKALLLSSADAELLYIRGLSRVELKKFNEAIIDLENSTRITPSVIIQQKINDLKLEYEKEIEQQKNTAIEKQNFEFEAKKSEMLSSKNTEFDNSFLAIIKKLEESELTKDLISEVDAQLNELEERAFFLSRIDFFMLRVYLYQALCKIDNNSLELQLAYLEKTLTNCKIILNISPEKQDLLEKINKIIQQNEKVKFMLYAESIKTKTEESNKVEYTNEELEEIDRKKNEIKKKFGI